MPQHPQAKKGHIDLSSWEFTDDQTITLNGEWEYFPNEFLDPTKNYNRLKSVYTTVPSSWSTLHHEDQENYGYGTYRLHVTLPNTDEETQYGLVFRRIINDADVFINGKHIDTFGNPSTSPGNTAGRNIPNTRKFQATDNELDLLVHVSNYEIPFYGGIISSVQIGTQTATIKERTLTNTLQLIVAIIFLLHAYMHA